jgi:hypothetical protein
MHKFKKRRRKWVIPISGIYGITNSTDGLWGPYFPKQKDSVKDICLHGFIKNHKQKTIIKARIIFTH